MKSLYFESTGLKLLNAMNIDVVSELSRTVDIVGADESIKVVIITGAGEKSFCAGADISYMVNIDPITAEKYASSAQSVLNKIERLDKPVIGLLMDMHLEAVAN